LTAALTYDEVAEELRLKVAEELLT